MTSLLNSVYNESIFYSKNHRLNIKINNEFNKIYIIYCEAFIISSIRCSIHKKKIIRYSLVSFKLSGTQRYSSKEKSSHTKKDFSLFSLWLPQLFFTSACEGRGTLVPLTSSKKKKRKLCSEILSSSSM